MPRSRFHEAGFTLIELLVCLALLALMTALLVEGLRFAMQPLNHQAARFVEAGKLPVTYNFLRTHLADARPIVPIEGTVGAVAFDGQAHRVMFVATAPQGADQGGLYLFRLEVTAEQLHIRWQLFEGMLAGDEKSANDSVLLDAVRRAELTYYGRRWSDANLGWHDEWRQMPYLPLLVQFEFELANGDRPPPLIIAPRLQPLRAVPVVNGPAAEISR